MTARFLFGTLLLSMTACQSTPDKIHLSEELIGDWHIESIQGRPTIDYSPAQLSFNNSGKLSGNNSCNSFEGQYQTSGTRLSLQMREHTERACINSLKNQEVGFMKAMEEIEQARFKSGKLQLTDAQGNTLLILSRCMDSTTLATSLELL